jgi:hypothetical protein
LLLVRATEFRLALFTKHLVYDFVLIFNDSRLPRTDIGLWCRVILPAWHCPYWKRPSGGVVTAQAIGKYENYEMMPGTGVLLVLARAVKLSHEYLFRDNKVTLSVVYFRNWMSYQITPDWVLGYLRGLCLQFFQCCRR